MSDWQAYAAATGSPDAYATVLAIGGTPDWEAGDAANDTLSEGTLGSLMALSAFRSEIGSLLLMVALLFGISGLVIGAFFTVWTMQRKGDVAVLKALGASTRSLVRDALGQALIVLVLGIGTGLSLVAVMGTFAGTALPFMLSPITTLLPGAIMIALGLAGAAFALPLGNIRRSTHSTREQPMIRLDNITLTFPDGDTRITAVDQVTSPAGPVR